MTSPKTTTARSTRQTTPPGSERGTAKRGARVLPWILCALAALGWVTVMTSAQVLGMPLYGMFLLVLVPGAVTCAVKGPAWPLVRRWLVVLLLAVAVDQTLLSPYLLVAFTWALHRSWVSEPAALRITEEKRRAR